MSAPTATGTGLGVAVERLDVLACTVPTDAPESDGTLAWDSTTIVVVESHGGGHTGLGYTYGHASAAGLIRDVLAEAVVGREASAVPAAWAAMARAVRNLGRPGVAAGAIAAVDTALWDLKARLLDLPLVTLLGAARESVELYGSGGFTSYTDERLAEQLGGWAEEGFGAVKLKVGREPGRDLERVAVARRALGAEPHLFVDANGALARKQALACAEAFAEHDVTWFEEPVSSDDLEGLRLLRDRAPAGMEIAAGEYGYDLPGFRRLLEAGAVDVLQADATRCAGITGFLRVAALCEAFGVPLSAHTAPALHLHVCCAVEPLRHLEWFHDHARVERMLFDGVTQPRAGRLFPDLSRPGLGLELKRADAERHLSSGGAG
ncbi:MAG: mandelate racemase [Actinobacteria bacterium]|nr:mandelate racemase [Actinomycetota bacterium]